MLQVIFLCLYTVAIVLGLTGNILVIVVVKRNVSMHTTTNYLLVNLAVADIITLLWCPPIYAVPLAEGHPTGIAGDVLCKFFTGNEIVDIATTISILTLTFLAVERYHALLKPLKNNLRLTKDNLFYAIALIWSLAILVSISGFVQFNYDESKLSCVGPWGMEMTDGMATFALFMVVFFVLIPFSIVMFCYCKLIKGLFFNDIIVAQVNSHNQDRLTKQKLVKLFATVTVGFFTCHMPFTTFIIYIASRKILDPTRVESSSSFLVFQFVSFFSLTNACINPIFYAFQSSNYRRGFKQIFRKFNMVRPLENFGMIINSFPGTPQISAPHSSQFKEN